MVESRSCFVAIPASQTSLREVIRDALRASGMQMLGDGDFSGTSLPVKAIQRADLMIADITELGPYVFYALGVADALLQARPGYRTKTGELLGISPGTSL